MALPETETTVWLGALSSLVTVPAAHVSATVQPDDAHAFLGCSSHTWKALLAEGLPPHDGAFERLDLVNLALHARSGGSTPEIALRHALRFATKGRQSWCTPKRWRLTLLLTCGEGAEDQPVEEAATDTSARSVDEAATGAEAGRMGAERWRVWPPLPWPPARSPDNAGSPVLHGRDTTDPCMLHGRVVEATYEVRVDGRKMQLVSPSVRSIVDAYLAEERRFVRMPTALQRELEWMSGHGLFDCLSASLDLQRRCARQGIEAHVRQGWLAGPIASQHAWLEILDEDGEWKTIDVAFRALAGLLYPACEEFRAFCLGSRLNRLLATDSPAAKSTIEHMCAGSGARTQTHITTMNTNLA
jgi:Transglutaminase-like superfamily